MLKGYIKINNIFGGDMALGDERLIFDFV